MLLLSLCGCEQRDAQEERNLGKGMAKETVEDGTGDEEAGAEASDEARNGEKSGGNEKAEEAADGTVSLSGNGTFGEVFSEEIADAELFDESIEALKENNTLPDGTVFSVAGKAEIEYGIGDVNRDGRSEMIVLVNAQSSSDCFEAVYERMEDGKIIRLFKEYPGLCFYENGNIMAPWSANPGLNSQEWPYTIYEYDSLNDMYIYAGYVDSWNKSENPTDYEKNVFPEEYDLDGDGVLYSLRYNEEYEYGYIYDGAELQGLKDRVFGRQLQVDMVKIV